MTSRQEDLQKKMMQHAKIIVDHSVKVRPDDSVLIKYEDYGLELAKAIAELSSERGALPMIYQVPSTFLRNIYKLTPEKNLSKLPRSLYSAVVASDVIVQIRGEEDLIALKDIDKNRMHLRAIATKPIYDVQVNKRWCLTQTPCPSYAKEAGMSLEEYEDFVYNAVLKDWKAEKKRLKVVEGLMNKTSEVRVLSKDTSLTLSIRGRKAFSDYGEKNMPGGEVFTTPVENYTHGYITFDLPIISSGNEASGIRLEFEKGRVVDYKASVGQDFLKSQIETDEGSHRFGEFAIGMNDDIDRFTKNLLFDEKMGGTIHAALGRGFPFCHGKNESAVHLDMVKTMKETELLFDGKIVMRAGKLVIPPEERQGGYSQF
jgi:aminopeptidase